ncbi:MAG TPA: ABC transporter permease subunit [Lacrimispora saccharolytica]|nr:ABC transporter permease subunit [Lacrimispora saccharolytica]
MTGRKEYEIKGIYAAVVAIFAVFLAVPVIRLLMESFMADAGVSVRNYAQVLTERGFAAALANSVKVSVSSALIATALAFFLAYTIQYTRVPGKFKSLIRLVAVLPMLLPTLTYGFAIIYSFGKQGLLTKLFGRQFFEIYGFGGLLFGYVIYTLPVSFLLILNTMGYIDKKFSVVSRIMGDSPFKNFLQTVVRPLLGTLAASMVQCFFLCFTDYGIPASVGGEYDVVATVLYNEMLGSVPNFNRGAVVAMMMLIPSVISIALLHYLERYNIRYTKISAVDLRKNRVRDGIFMAGSAMILLMLISVFAVIFVVPLVREWPYQTSFTMEHVIDTLTDSSLFGVYQNSLFVAVCTAAAGLLITYGAALATARSGLKGRLKAVIDSIALVTNTIPGMVIGIAFMFIFSGTPLQNTFLLIIICNVVHFFSTPYLMMKNSLSKLNSSWEATAALMGDSWIKTIVRIITPNMVSTLLEVFGYYFVNAMVTVSAVIFIAGARTMVITTKMKELQYYTKFNEVFVLSLLILATNLAVKGILAVLMRSGKIGRQQARA